MKESKRTHRFSVTLSFAPKRSSDKTFCDERLGAKLRITDNRFHFFDSFTYIYIYIYIYLCTHQIIYDLVALSLHLIPSNFLFLKRKSFGHFDGYGLVGNFQSVSISSMFSHPFSPLFYFHLVIFCQLCKAISIYLKEIHNGLTMAWRTFLSNATLRRSWIPFWSLWKTDANKLKVSRDTPPALIRLKVEFFPPGFQLSQVINRVSRPRGWRGEPSISALQRWAEIRHL